MIAELTVNKPGKMSKQGRADVAAWLRRQATNLIKQGEEYADDQFRARYLYAPNR